MQGRRITTFEHAHDIVRHFRLDKFEWSDFGSAEGFANMLYLFEDNDDLETVCGLLAQYRRDCKERFTTLVNASPLLLIPN
jgi:hypothetical protein